MDFDPERDLVRYIFMITDCSKLRYYTDIAIDCLNNDFDHKLWQQTVNFHKQVLKHSRDPIDHLFIIIQAICASHSFFFYLNKYVHSSCMNLENYKKWLQTETVIKAGGRGEDFAKCRPRELCFCYGVQAAPKTLMSNCKHKKNKIPCCTKNCFGAQHECGDVSAKYGELDQFVHAIRLGTFTF